MSIVSLLATYACTDGGQAGTAHRDAGAQPPSYLFQLVIGILLVLSPRDHGQVYNVA
jgi:hypothetical protein